MNALPHIISDQSVTLLIDGSPETVYSDHPNYPLLIDAIKSGAWDTVPKLVSIPKAVEFFSDGDVEIKDGAVFYKGYERRSSVANKILNLMSEGFNVTPLTRFLARVERNPLITAREELYDFCEANGFMIDEDGFLIAYKAVRNDYKDIYTGTMDNSVGATPSMPRENVDEDRRRTCSRGLHFAAYDYAAQSYGSVQTSDRRLMIVRVDPADVVAIPSDYNNQKGRAWRYQVIGEIKRYDGFAPLDRTTFRRDDFEVQPFEDENYCDECGDIIDIGETLCDACQEAEDEYADYDDDFWDAYDDDPSDEDREEDEIRDALFTAQGVIEGPKGAATALGLTPRSLRRRIEKYGIDLKVYRKR